MGRFVLELFIFISYVLLSTEFRLRSVWCNILILNSRHVSVTLDRLHSCQLLRLKIIIIFNYCCYDYFYCCNICFSCYNKKNMVSKKKIMSFTKSFSRYPIEKSGSKAPNSYNPDLIVVCVYIYFIRLNTFFNLEEI